MGVSRKTLHVIETKLGREVNISILSNETILSALNANNIGIDQSCGGHGTCTTCRFERISDSKTFSDANELEIEISIEKKMEKNLRLSCQTYVVQDATIKINK